MVFDQRVESNALSESSESKGRRFWGTLVPAAYSLGTSTFILVGGQ